MNYHFLKGCYNRSQLADPLLGTLFYPPVMLFIPMGDTEPAESPLESVAEVTGAEVVEAFKSLANETRLAILLAIWETQDPEPGSHLVDTGPSFSEIRKRLGTPDSGKFNYHLNELVGKFIEETDDGYSLTTAAERVLRTVFAGSLGKYESFECEPIDAKCQQCGGESVVIDYNEGWITKRCTECLGQYTVPDLPSGLLAYLFRPPTGLVNRSPQEFHRATNIWSRNRLRTVFRGVCPDCAGRISGKIDTCPDHDSTDGAVCDQCESVFEIQPFFVCEVCKSEHTGAWHSPPLTDQAVKRFFFEHGHDPDELYIESSQHILHETVEDVELLSEEPPRVRVIYEIDGDRLDVTLDEDTNVLDVSEE